MEQTQHPPLHLAKKGVIWKRYLIDAMLAIFIVVPIPLILSALHIYPDLSLLLLLYLFIVLGLAFYRGFWVVVLAALTACIATDFLLIEPHRSFAISHLGEGFALLAFLLLAVLLGFMYSKVQAKNQQEHAESVLYQERLREEVTRHGYEDNIYQTVLQKTRDKNDVKYQLGFISQKIEEVYSSCGLRSCLIFAPDLDGKLTLQRLPEQQNTTDSLTNDEMRSVAWAMGNGKSLRVQNIPLIARDKGSYVRRAVSSSGTHEPVEYGYSDLIPLFSQEKVLGVMRILIEDTDHPRLRTIKHALEKECLSNEEQRELFTKLKVHAVTLIQQALIERALMQEESMRQELAQRTEELQAALISSVSHDLRTPLVAIKAAASNLLDEDMLRYDCEGYREAVQTILDEAGWLGRILVRMIDISRIEQGALKLDKDLYPVDMIILDTLELKHIRSLLHNRALKRNVPDDLPPVEVDPILISQVLGNLIENAIRYTPASEPIEIRAEILRDEMLISVADHGPGIPEEEQERVFDKFYQVKSIQPGINTSDDSSQTMHGTGLGLAVCRGFVAAHGGRIWVHNRPAGGAEFSFTLPLKRSKARNLQSNGTTCIQRRREEDI